jgi:YbbR domain-containing protein
MRSFFSYLLTLLFAFLIALIIWFVAIRESDPLSNKSLLLPVETRGVLPAEGSVRLDDDTVRIFVEAPQSILAPLTSQDFAAYIDLASVPWGESVVPIQVELLADRVQVVLQEPQTTRVVAEQYIDRQVPVQVLVRGNPARGHEAGTPVVEPETVLVSGPEPRVNQLARAEVSVLIDGAREDVVMVRRPTFYDRNGVVVSMTGLEMSVEEVTVVVPIDEVEGVAEVPIIVNWVGEPALGYRLLQVSAEPQSVLISGAPTVLENVRAVPTEVIDIAGLNASFEQRVTLALPPDVELAEVQPVLASFEIEPILTTSVLREEPEIRALGVGLTATVSPELVTVFLFGPLPVLDTVTGDDVLVTVDLLDLKVGTHSVEPLVRVLANGVEVRSFQPEFVTVTITETEVVTGTRPRVDAGIHWLVPEGKQERERESKTVFLPIPTHYALPPSLRFL